MKPLYFTLICFLFGQMAWAQNLNVSIYYSEYQNTSGNPYIEVYFSLNPRSVTLLQNQNGLFQGEVNTLVTILQGEKIVNYDKFKFLTPEISENSTQIAFSFQQSRMSIAPGNYTLKIELADVNNPENTTTVLQEIEVGYNRNDMAASNILILDSYKETTQNIDHAKYGFELVPIVPSGTYYLREDVKVLPFYFELYNTDKVLGLGVPFVIKYVVKDKVTGKILPNYSGFHKATGTIVQPILKSFNITELSTGFYEIEISVVNKQNEELALYTTPFYRRNGNVDIQNTDLSTISVANTFVQGMMSTDTLGGFIDCLYPIATGAERLFASNVLAAENLENMQAFFYNFWQKRDPLDPYAAWQKYLDEVNKTNKLYGSSTVPGYRTSMGRVFLQYGAPTFIERSDRDPSNYPYQIWQYDQLMSADSPLQTNQMFVFVDQTLTGRNYSLIHSTALGEVRDMKWQYQLNRNTNRGQNVDDVSTQYGRDNFGYRVNNNFIIGDHRYWGDR